MTEHQPKNKRSKPDPLPRRHWPCQNQATHYLSWRSNFWDCLLCLFSFFFRGRTFFVEPFNIDHTWTSSHIPFHFSALLLLLLLLDIFYPLKPSDTVSLRNQRTGVWLNWKDQGNQICTKYSIHPSTLSKRMTGKVLGMGCQLGGARRGRILTAGEFQPTQ